MKENIIAAPYVHTDKNRSTRAWEWLVAVAPVLVWSVYMYGARVISVCLVAALFSLGIDFIVQRFVFKASASAAIDVMAAVYGILVAFMMPVTVPLWLPIIAAVFVVIAKNLRVIRKRRLFNPFVFSAALLNIIFKGYMTAFTRPFAYFSAFSINIDPKLIEGYRVISPLQYMADGSVYEDGVMAQLYGFASGNIGEIAVAAMILSFIWLIARREGDWRGTVSLLLPIIILGLLFPSDDAESNYYAFSVLLAGGAVFMSVFAINENQTVPISKLGKAVFGALCGIALFFLRKLGGGFEFGYFALLALNVVSPFIDMLTKPKAIGSASPATKN